MVQIDFSDIVSAIPRYQLKDAADEMVEHCSDSALAEEVKKRAFDPEDLFSDDVLEYWAKDHGFVSEDDI